MTTRERGEATPHAGKSETRATLLRGPSPFAARIDRERDVSVHVVLRGAVELSIAGVGAEASAGAVVCVITPTKSLHDVAAPRPALSVRACQGFVELVSLCMADSSASTSRPSAGARILRMQSADHPPVATALELLRAELAQSTEDAEVVSSLMRVVALYSLRAANALSPETSASATPQDRRIARAVEALRAAPARRWTVRALARECGLSRSAFARRFAAATGLSPLRYLAQLRVDLARHLLTSSDDGLAAIAAEVGYDSEFAFSRAFKRHTGVAPGTFRRQFRASAATFACAA